MPMRGNAQVVARIGHERGQGGHSEMAYAQTSGWRFFGWLLFGSPSATLQEMEIGMHD